MDHVATKRTINLNSASFIASAHFKRDWPLPEKAELAFAGRSNVGKSSAINAITNHKGLAKTSKTPGRTQQIVFFELASGHRLVDLPGYGYAKVPIKIRQHWEKLVSDYLSNRPTLKALILPMDARRPLTPLDRQMLHWSAAADLAVHILLTKADKLSRNQAAASLLALRKQLPAESRITLQLFSALTKQGVDEARATIMEFLEAE
jgi:GTP-binding protein